MTTEAQERVDDDNEADQQKKSIPDLGSHWRGADGADEPLAGPIDEADADTDDQEHEETVDYPIAVREDNFSQHSGKRSPG
jgi:hypothetical protein